MFWNTSNPNTGSTIDLGGSKDHHSFILSSLEQFVGDLSFSNLLNKASAEDSYIAGTAALHFPMT